MTVVRGGRPAPHLVMVLYAQLENDGRAKRMFGILSTLGETQAIDTCRASVATSVHETANRVLSVGLSSDWGIFRRHIWFWYKVLQHVLSLRPQVIIAEDYYTVAICRVAASLIGARLVYDAHELILPTPGDVVSFRDRFWYQLEKWAIRRTDLVIAANRERAGIMRRHYDRNLPVTYMRNIPDFKGDDIENSSGVSFPSLKENKQTRVLLYQGYVSSTRGLDLFIAALAHLPKEVRLVILGDGPDLTRYRSLAQELDDENRLELPGRIPHAELPKVMPLADIGIVTYSYRGLNNLYCAPNKLHEYARAGLPIVSTSQPPLRRIIEGYGIGELVPDGASSATIAKSILRVLSDPETYRRGLARFVEDNQWSDEVTRVQGALAVVLEELNDGN